MKIGNINVGSKTKKSFFDMTHDVSTTSDFGFCQPTLVQAVMPRSSFAFSSHSFVRLAPMPCPTFGRIKVKQDCVYVPMKEVFTAFNEMQAGVTVNNPNAGKYVPQSVDYLYTRDLFDQMISLCNIPTAQMNDDTFKLSNSWLFRQMFTMSISSTYNPVDCTLEDEEFDYLDLFKRYSDKGTLIMNLYFQILSRLGINSDSFTLEDYPIVNPQQVKTKLNFQLGFANETTPGLDFLQNGDYVCNYLLHCFFSPEVINKFNTGNVIDSRLGALYNAFKNMPEQFQMFFNAPRSQENADFSYNFIPVDIPFVDDGGPSWLENNFGYSFRLNFHLTPFGKRLMKIFIACGWNFGIIDFKCDMPKLYAYYKAWFDLYNIGRDSQWADTHAFKLIHSFFDDPRPLRDKIYHSADYKYDEDIELQEFLRELSMCCYNLDADPITVSTYDPLLSKGLSTVPFAGVSYPIGRSDTQTIGVNGGSLYPSTNPTLNLDSLSVTFLSRLYEYVNKESAIANKIEDYMRVKYGVDIRSTAILKRSDFDCQISDIMGTVNNDQTALGEYAGKGIGAGDSGIIKFDVPEQGFVIQLTTIVPLGGYAQANEKSQIVKEDFYIPEFDSMGNEEIRTSQVFARDSIINAYGADGTFGFRPRYFSLKYKNNLNNGGFSFRSDRASFLPYCLDRLFTESHFLQTTVMPYGATLPTTKVIPMKGITLFPDERLRSLGLVESYGNYNRIFYDTSGVSDNFIIHMIQDFKYYAPMKPISESYDTYDDEVDNNSQPIDHA